MGGKLLERISSDEFKSAQTNHRLGGGGGAAFRLRWRRAVRRVENLLRSSWDE